MKARLPATPHEAPQGSPVGLSCCFQPLATLGWFSGRWPPGAGSPGAGACWDHASAPGPLPLRRQPLPGMFSAQIPGWLARWHHAQIPLRKNFPISASETSPPRSPSLRSGCGMLLFLISSTGLAVVRTSLLFTFSLSPFTICLPPSNVSSRLTASSSVLNEACA